LAKIAENCDHNIGLLIKTPIFFAENWLKLQKIVIITSTPAPACLRGWFFLARRLEWWKIFTGCHRWPATTSFFQGSKQQLAGKKVWNRVARVFLVQTYQKGTIIPLNLRTVQQTTPNGYKLCQHFPFQNKPKLIFLVRK
jgi:hypothetical protein